MSADPSTSLRRVALTAIVLGTVGIAVAYATAFAPPSIATYGPMLMAIALPVTMVAVMTLGTIRRGKGLGALAIPFALILILVVASFAFALTLPPDQPDAPLWLGLPKRAAIVLYGVGIFPLFVLPLAYAWTFDRFTLTDDDVARVRAARLAGASTASGATIASASARTGAGSNAGGQS